MYMYFNGLVFHDVHFYFLWRFITHDVKPIFSFFDTDNGIRFGFQKLPMNLLQIENI